MNSSQIRLRGILPNIHNAAKKRMDRREEARKCGEIFLAETQKAAIVACPDIAKISNIKEAQRMSLSEFEAGLKLTIIPGENAAFSEKGSESILTAPFQRH